MRRAIQMKFVSVLTVAVFCSVACSEVAFAESKSGFEMGFAAGGGPALSNVSGKFTSTASGSASMMVGAQFGNGWHLDALFDSSNVEPLHDAPSEGLMPTGYLMDFGSFGLRLGHRWGRFHLWGDAAIASLHEEGEFGYRRERDSAGHTMFGGGVGFEFAKWENFTIEAYAGAKQLNRMDDDEYAQVTGRNILVQNYGLAFNFYPGMFESSGSTVNTNTTIYCFDCGFHLARFILEVGSALPQIGSALTQLTFAGLAR